MLTFEIEYKDYYTGEQERVEIEAHSIKEALKQFYVNEARQGASNVIAYGYLEDKVEFLRG